MSAIVAETMPDDDGIPTLFVHDCVAVGGPRRFLASRVVTPGCEWVQEGLGTPTRLIGETHGEQLLPEMPRDYDTLRDFFVRMPMIEGIVWWHIGDGESFPKRAKVTRADFGLKKAYVAPSVTPLSAGDPRVKAFNDLPVTPEQIREVEDECARLLSEARKEFKAMADEAREHPPEIRVLFSKALRALAAEMLVMCDGLES